MSERTWDKTVTTGAVAAILGVHPNTLRWYEEAGYLPSVPRTPKGYRQFSPELVRLAQVVRESQPLLRIYGPIRRATFSFLQACREDCVATDAGITRDADRCTDPYLASRERLNALTRLLEDEHRLALDALAALDRFRNGEMTEPNEYRIHANDAAHAHSRPGRLRYIGAAAGRTGLSRDRIINWERDGLFRCPRSNAGYRLFGIEEIDRLLIIRSCRTAGYSITAIRRLLRAIDFDLLSSEESLRTIADTPAPHETELFPVFPTDTLPVTLEEMIVLTSRLRGLLR